MGASGNVQNSGTNTATLTLGGSGNYVFSGTIAPPSQPTRTALNVALTGNGSQTLTGSNTYTGATTITSGILQLGNDGTTGSLAAGSAIVDNGTLAINRSNAVTQGTDFSSAAITGSGGIHPGWHRNDDAECGEHLQRHDLGYGR